RRQSRAIYVDHRPVFALAATVNCPCDEAFACTSLTYDEDSRIRGCKLAYSIQYILQCIALANNIIETQGSLNFLPQVNVFSLQKVLELLDLGIRHLQFFFTMLALYGI